MTYVTRSALHTPPTPETVREGAAWAYSPTLGTSVDLVRVTAVSDTDAEVQFFGSDLAGPVPLAHLRTPWANVAEYLNAVRRWDAIAEEKPTAEGSAAAAFVYNTLGDALGAKPDTLLGVAVTAIYDLPKLTELTKIYKRTTNDNGLSFTEDGVLYVPWSLSSLIARNLAHKFRTDIIRALVADEAARAARLAEYASFTSGAKVFGKDGHTADLARYAKDLAAGRALVAEWTFGTDLNSREQLTILTELNHSRNLLAEIRETLLRGEDARTLISRVDAQLGK